MLTTTIRALLCLFAALIGAGQVRAANSVYVDPHQLELPVPYYSFSRQPWRSYLEVMPATTYLNGLGAVWGPPVPGRTEDEVAAELAAAGFRRVRLELPWGALRWDEEGIVPEHAARTLRVLAALRRHGLRPLILLNAHHGAPCPMHVTDWRVAQAVSAGSRRIPLSGPIALVPAGRGLVLTLGDGGVPGPLVTGLSADGRAIELSRPLARPLAQGLLLQIGELKYLPLEPVGTAEFERTAAGWVKYVSYITRLVKENYGPEFDLEIWNELTFGSAFLDIANYYDPRPVATEGDFLHAGGRAWELGRRTVDAVAAIDPAAQVIWGFSNTTFFHTAVADLPPGTAGQSYHPYGVGPRCYAQQAVGRLQYNADGFVPTGCATIPEGWAQSFQQTETLMRLLNPAARRERPLRSSRFAHYITEHGMDPRELGVKTQADAQRARSKFLLRAPLFWLNKGIQGLYIFNTFDPEPMGFGLLAADGSASAGMQALQRLVQRIGQARTPSSVRHLDARITPVGRLPPHYANDRDGRIVAPQDVVVLLPFDTGTGRLVVGLYVMTEDFPRDLPPQTYRIELTGIAAQDARVSFYDPLSGTLQPVDALARSGTSLTVQVELTDVPRLLEIIES